ncbi:MAG: flagellar biosynthesis anti-sigma factor FlgM [Spirochaetes bacterium]|nr:flagellar biosynthesis anti-sigma factor FlgM [Spirochaetota bacterium]
MTVESIGPLDQISKVKKNSKPASSKNVKHKDSIHLSEEARAKSEIYKATEIAKQVPNVRMDKVEEARRKLADPSYINKKTVEIVADKILESFGLE